MSSSSGKSSNAFWYKTLKKAFKVDEFNIISVSYNFYDSIWLWRFIKVLASFRNPTLFYNSSLIKSWFVLYFPQRIVQQAN